MAARCHPCRSRAPIVRGVSMGTAVSELIDRFSEQFGEGRELAHVHAPARSEIAGNHTDHEGGHVVAGALDVSIEGVAALNGTMTARVASAGYEPFEIDLSDLTPREDEKVSTAGLVRGMAADLAATGRECRASTWLWTAISPVAPVFLPPRRSSSLSAASWRRCGPATR